MQKKAAQAGGDQDGSLSCCRAAFRLPFYGGALPIGALPTIGSLPTIGIGSLPTGALPITGVGGGGWRVGISAATAALAKASVEAMRMRNFVMC
jgi:hypothetical protein